MYQPLVRKYGVFHFDNIIGQSIVVKILKNTLFLNHLFPFYLFSGKHGCGKTSTARLFSTAINCEQRPLFQKDPSILLPCLLCTSCKAMERIQHPDFIEIDAASHTGVDNIRVLIDSATLLPIVGRKKIYLIDEAHMLSKAACNAFLKLLEEPPQHVIFILATTAPEKIIETVRSRAFQLLFHAIPEQAMCDYLGYIATTENIKYTKEGIKTLVRRGGGSVRDTLQLLDQANLAVSAITPETVREVFGGISESDVVDTLVLIFGKNTEKISVFLKKHCSDHAQNALHLFEAILEHSYQLFLFLCHQNNASLSLYQKEQYSFLVEKGMITKKIALTFLLFLYDQEAVIKRVDNPALFLEIMLLKWMQEQGIVEQKTIPLSPTVSASESHQENKPKVLTSRSVHHTEEKNGTNQWDQFLEAIKAQNDPLLSSVFTQAVFHCFDANEQRISIHFKKEQHFFATLLEEHKQDWITTLQHIFGPSATLTMQFVLDGTLEQKPMIKQHSSSPSQSENPEDTKATKNRVLTMKQPVVKNGHAQQRTSYFAQKQSQRPQAIIDVSDGEKWPYAQRIQGIFRGIITEVEKT